MGFDRYTIHKVWLFLVFIVGIVLIAFLKIKPYSDTWIIGTPIVLIVVYWLSMWFANPSDQYEAIGDNCYYLGFVFTLTSLAVTLYLLHQSEDQELVGPLAVRDVISGFGIALSSTILGIMLRVLMLRMVPYVNQREQDVRVDLDLAVRDFRTHLSMSIGELKRFSIETIQLISEQRKSVLDTIEAEADAHKIAKEESINAIIRSQEETAKRLSDHRASLLADLQEDSKIYRDAVQEDVAAFRKALDALNSVLQVPTKETEEALRTNLANLREVLETGTGNIQNAIEQAMDAFSKFQVEVDKLTGMSRKTIQVTDENVNAARERLEDAKKLIGTVEDISREKHDLSSVLSDLGKELGRVEESISKCLDPAIARMGKRTDSVALTLSESSEKLSLAAVQFENAAKRTIAADMLTNVCATAEGIGVAANKLEMANDVLAKAIERLDELTERKSKSRKGWIGVFGSRKRKELES